jgi:hypothetical protein
MRVVKAGCKMLRPTSQATVIIIDTVLIPKKVSARAKGGQRPLARSAHTGSGRKKKALAGAFLSEGQRFQLKQSLAQVTSGYRVGRP